MLPGKPFLIWLHPLQCSSKGPSGEKTQAYPLPQVNRVTGPSHFLSPNGSLYETKWCGTAGLFCPRCLSMGDFKLSSQFKKLYVYIASMVKFLGNFCLSNYLRLQSSGVNTESRVMCIPQNEEVPAPGIKWDGEEVRLNSSNLPFGPKHLRDYTPFQG